MRVIQLPSWPVYSYVDENGNNAIRSWLDTNRISTALRAQLQVQIDIAQYSGTEVTPGSVVGVNAGFEAFKGVRKGEPPVYLIFRRGIFTEREITLLVATHKPKDAVVKAGENLRDIERNLERRVYEPIIRRTTRGV